MDTIKQVIKQTSEAIFLEISKIANKIKQSFLSNFNCIESRIQQKDMLSRSIHDKTNKIGINSVKNDEGNAIEKDPHSYETCFPKNTETQHQYINQKDFISKVLKKNC